MITLPVIFTKSTGMLSIMIDNAPVIIDANHKQYFKILDMICVNGEFEEKPISLSSKKMKKLKKLISNNIPQKIGELEIRNQNVFYRKYKLPKSMAKKVKSLIAAKKDLTYFINFIKKVDTITEYIKNQLYRFIDKNNLVINKSGNFYAYKYVTKNFKDVHTQTFDNSIGKIVEMDRNDVDPDPDETCSTGLHVCGYGYLSHAGDQQKIILVEVDPRDVVSIPTDYNSSKMRCCRYNVIKEIKSTADILKSAETIEDIDNTPIDELREIFIKDKKVSKRIQGILTQGGSIYDVIYGCFKIRPKNVRAQKIYRQYSLYCQ